MYIIWLFGLLIIAYLIRHWYVCPARILKKRKLLNQKPIVIFDLHGVIVKKKILGICQHVFNHIYRLDMLLLCFKPSFFRDIFNLLKKSRVPEEFIIKLSEKHHKLQPFIDVTIDMMNEQKIIDATFVLIKRLKYEGYQLYLFSNIGEKTFAQLEKKFPDLFRYFDGIVVAEQQDDWIQKPYPAAFTKFLSRFGFNANQCIFIDNSRTNVKAALYEGMYPILFQSPSQVFHELMAIDIL